MIIADWTSVQVDVCCRLDLCETFWPVMLFRIIIIKPVSEHSVSHLISPAQEPSVNLWPTQLWQPAQFLLPVWRTTGVHSERRQTVKFTNSFSGPTENLQGKTTWVPVQKNLKYNFLHLYFKWETHIFSHWWYLADKERIWVWL